MFVVRLLIRVAELCFEMNNYDSAMIIVAVLSDACIQRLGDTWNEVERIYPGHFEALQRMLNPGEQRNSKSIDRQAEYSLIKLSSDPPCMPAMAYVVSSLKHLGKKDSWFSDYPADDAVGLINFDRMRRSARVLDIVVKSQAAMYPFTKLDQTLLALLLIEPQWGDEDGAWHQSKRVEKKRKSMQMKD